MKILHQNALFLHQIFINFLGRGLCPFPRLHPLPFCPSIPSFWIHHCQLITFACYQRRCYVFVCWYRLSARRMRWYWLLFACTVCCKNQMFASYWWKNENEMVPGFCRLSMDCTVISLGCWNSV